MSREFELGNGLFSEVELPAGELFLRLGTKELTDDMKECIERVKECAECRYCYVRLPLFFHSEDVFSLGNLRITSHELGKYLKGCKECFLIAVTLGAGVDRLISKLGVTSPAKQFVADAAASALVEGVCDKLVALLSEHASCKGRFSPGYGDFLLDYQPDILALTEAGKRVGLHVTDSLFLTPSKSVTAVIGIK